MDNLTFDWWAHQDLNLGPLGYEPIALTAELWARNFSLQETKFFCKEGLFF